MAVRCSLLGHSFGATEVERQREERGSEVVVTVVEYESCTRCGTRNVLSENTEVKRLEPDEPEPDRTAGASTPSGDDAGAAAPDATETDGPAEPEPAAPEEPVPTDENGEPITDDAEILDDTDDTGGETADGDRERGAWPDADDVGQPAADESESTEWPDADADEDGGAELVDEDAQRGAEASTDEAVESAEPTPAASEPATGSGIERAGAAPTPGETSAREDVPVEFFCPRCSFVASGDRGSLRAGDICPECKKGYLSERER